MLCTISNNNTMCVKKWKPVLIIVGMLYTWDKKKHISSTLYFIIIHIHTPNLRSTVFLNLEIVHWVVMLQFVRIHNVSSTVMSTFHYDFFQHQCKTFSFNMRMFLNNSCNQNVLQTVCELHLDYFILIKYPYDITWII